MAAGSRLLAPPQLNKSVSLPSPLSAGGSTFDIVADLVEYTGLDRPSVEALLLRRPENFRTEWHAFPRHLRRDRWFYLSSRMYLFGNAVHVHDRPKLLDFLEQHAAPGLPVLDFGGGTGNVALALAARNRDVDYLELSALQKDFTRFRVAKHGMEAQVRILDEWQPLPPSRYGLICAIDVLEHVPEPGRTAGRLVDALATGGVLVENTVFGSTTHNPMHLEDEGDLGRVLRARLELVEDQEGRRVWRSR